MSITTKNKLKREFGGGNSGKGFIVFPGQLDRNITQAQGNLGSEGFQGHIDRLNYDGDIEISFTGVPEGVTLNATVFGLGYVTGGSYNNPVNGVYNCEMVVTGGSQVETIPFTITVNIGG